MTEIEINGLYLIDDSFFSTYPNDRYMQNKGENRPHYFAIRDDSGLYWMIPMSTKVEKYRQKIEAIERRSGKGRCFMYYLTSISGRERAVLICDMFPVTAKYILRPYTICGEPYIVRNRTICKDIRSKALRYLKMVERGQIHSPLNIIELKKALLTEQENMLVAQ